MYLTKLLWDFCLRMWVSLLVMGGPGGVLVTTIRFRPSKISPFPGEADDPDRASKTPLPLLTIQVVRHSLSGYSAAMEGMGK